MVPSLLDSVEEAPAASGGEDVGGHFSVNFLFPIKAFSCVLGALAVLMARRWSWEPLPGPFGLVLALSVSSREFPPWEFLSGPSNHLAFVSRSLGQGLACEVSCGLGGPLLGSWTSVPWVLKARNEGSEIIFQSLVTQSHMWGLKLSRYTWKRNKARNPASVVFSCFVNQRCSTHSLKQFSFKFISCKKIFAVSAWVKLLLSSVRLFVTPMDCSPSGLSVHGILQARILEWVAVSSSRTSSKPQGSNPHLLCLLHWQDLKFVYN